MANIPTPRSWNQIVGDQVSAFLSRFGLKSLKVGSPVLSIIEAAAQSDLRSSQDLFDLLNSIVLDRAKGLALDRIGADEDLPREPEGPASGTVTVTDTSFTKISSRVYQGLPAPIIGSSSLYVTDASSFPSSGTVFIGRGSTNYEGPLAYSAKTNAGTYWVLTLSDNTRRFHNQGETVIVGQGGNRLIDAGSVVQTPQGNITDAVKFSTLFAATIPDGETQITGVQVIAQIPGVGSNVPARAISSFVALPFAGATVVNSLPYTNGQASEDDKTYRERIKARRRSRAKGTPLAIETEVQGIIATDENKRLSSASVVVRQDFPTTLYIDDGTGYEEKSTGVSTETLVDSALGGEQFFQVAASLPIAKAFVLSVNQAPFALIGGSKLSARVGGKTYEHTFDPTAFRSVGNASAYEIASAINGNATLGFGASTANGGTQVRIFSRTDTNEDIEVLTPVAGVDANDALLFPLGRVDTLRLYKNDRLLSKDGSLAVIQSQAPALWAAFVSGETLIMAVDGTTAVTYTFVDQDFIDASTGFTAVGRNDPASWAKVLNRKIPGITAVVANGLLEISSNVGRSSRAKISISGGSLVTPGQMFSAQTVSGADNDYTLDRNAGQLRLEIPLVAGDSLKAGSLNTRAFVESTDIATTSIGGAGAKNWFLADGDAQIISTGLSGATVLNTTVSRLGYWGNRIRITAGSSVFSNVRAGDWLIAYDAALNAAMKGTWRVAQAAATYVEIERQAMLAGRRNFSATILNDGKILVAGGELVTGACTPSCEIFDPATNTWSPTGAMAEGRRYHSAVLINSSGKVLVVGGQNLSLPAGTNAEIDAQFLRTAEIYDPVAGTWSPAASLPAGQQRAQMFACRATLPAEMVVIAGGNQTVATVVTQLNTTYKYDPIGNSWAAGANMGTGRSNGVGLGIVASTKLLTAGGMTGSSATSSVNTTEVYDPNTNTWTAGPAMVAARRGAQGVLRADGKVLVTGGLPNASSAALATAEVYDPAGAGSWTATTGPMATARTGHGSTLLGNNKILVAFGWDGTTPSLSAEVYDPATGLFSASGAVKSVYERRDGRAVLLTGGDALMIGGSESASAERYSPGGNSWSVPDEGAAQVNFSLTTAGLVFVRSSALVQETLIPPGASYTAKNFVDSLNTQLRGASAKTFHTTRIRVNTRSYQIGGDIAMVAADTEGTKLNISSGPAVENLSTHLASVLSGSKQAGNPEFSIPYVYYGESGTKFRSYDLSQSAGPQSLIVGLRSYDDVYNSATPVYRHGNNLGFTTALQEVQNYLTKEQLLISRDTSREWISRDRFYVAAPLSLGPSDDITVLVDQDSGTKRFTVPLARRLTPVGAYGSTNTFKDADNGGASLAAAFGLGYDFNDFALYMQARGKTHSADAGKRILWRYTRPGPDGNKARLRYVYPAAENLPVSVSTSILASKYTDISVALPSGALRTGYPLHTGSKIGLANAVSGSIKILNFSLGYPAASATRTQRLKFVGQTVNFTAGEVITGGTSGVTATIVSVISDAGATGVLQITGSSGTFNASEALTGGLGGNGSTNGSQYYQVDLTLTLPSIGSGALMDITAHGFAAADTLYLNSSNGNFPSGLKTLTAVTTTTVSYTEATTTEITQANIGTVSFDPAAEAAWTGASIAVGDMLRLDIPSDPDASLTLRIGYLSAQTIQSYVEVYNPAPTSVPTWSTAETLGVVIKIFALSSGSCLASSLATAVKALADAQNSSCPVTAVITGTGAGTVLKSGWEEALALGSWLQLSDGVNYVKATTSPGTLAGDYQLSFKAAIGSDLATDSDWTNEVVRLVPLTVKNLSTWFNTLTVTGLSSACSIEASDQGQRLQITSLTPGSVGSVQVQGGSGNEGSAAVSGASSLATDPDSSSYAVVTVKKSDAQGFFAGMWVKIQNLLTANKNVIQPTTELTSLGTNGVLVLNSGANTPLWTYSNSGPVLSKTWQIEKQGRYICYSFDGQYPGASLPDLTGVKEGDWVRIISAATPSANAVAVSSLNTGVYRVVRVETGSTNVKARAFWVENPNGVEERSESDVAFYGFDSVMPGDSLSISTDLWGSGNKGTWTVESVGAIGGTGPQFVNSAAGKHTLKLVISSRTPEAVSTPGALGSVQYRLVQVLEAQASKFIKKIRTISPNQTDATYVDIKFESSAGSALIGSAAGSIVSPLDKLGFSADLAQGIDGYSRNTGLIAEANRVAYGDRRDPATYPGVVSAGAKLNISGPLVKRVQVALNLRVRNSSSTVNTTDVGDRVRSAVASVVNGTGIGKAIAISDIINAASKVTGVVAVSVVSPVFSSESDLIPVQPYEKPLVLNLEQDVLISFAGE